MDLIRCSACSRHVKSSDAACPFCGASSGPSGPAPRATPRMSRAGWLAFGPAVAALVGCGGTISTSSTSDDGGATQGVTGDTPPQGAACTLRLGYFACGSTLCNRSIEACYTQGSDGSPSCVSYDTLVSYGTLGQSCGACPTCNCLSDTGATCSQDVGGAMAIVTSSVNTCYGAPPARLERMA